MSANMPYGGPRNVLCSTGGHIYLYWQGNMMRRRRIEKTQGYDHEWEICSKEENDWRAQFEQHLTECTLCRETWAEAG